MLKAIWNWLFKKHHRHDFEMVFPDSSSLRYIFKCECGMEASSMEEAYRLQGK